MKRYSQDQTKPTEKPIVERNYAAENSFSSEKLASLKQLAADYKKLGMCYGGVLMILFFDMPVVKQFMAKASSKALSIAASILGKASSAATKGGAAAAGETGIGAAIGVAGSVVFAFIEGYKLGAFAAPYIYGDMANFSTKTKALMKFLADNNDYDGGKTDPKIKALNNELSSYEVELSGALFGLSGTGKEGRGLGGMAVLQEKIPELTNAQATSKHLSATASAMKDVQKAIDIATKIKSDDFKKRYYDVHYVQGFILNPAQELNQAQSIAEALISELNEIAKKVTEYVATVRVFGDQIIADANDIFKEEPIENKPIDKKTYIISNFMKVAQILKLYR